MEGIGGNGYVIGSHERRSVIKWKIDSRTWISFIECILATGVYLDPAVIYILRPAPDTGLERTGAG